MNLTQPSFSPFLLSSQLEKEAAHIAKKEESEIKHATKALAHAEKSETKGAKVRSLDLNFPPSELELIALPSFF